MRILILQMVLLFTAPLQAQYISKILEYMPAPGQFINTDWGSQEAAESILGGIEGAMSLGAFGGYVIFSFDQPVDNDPANPYGIDFTIFGNPMPFWAEYGIVSVMKDENANDLPDDTWYELAGSDYFFSTTIKNYEVTYNNPGSGTAEDVFWRDNQADSGFIFVVSYHEQPIYPSYEFFPGIDQESYTLKGSYLPDPVRYSSSIQLESPVKAFGYADSRGKKREPFTFPDNPYTPEIENSGGDAFDISWAVDQDGNYVDLDVIDFIKVQTASQANAAWLGEFSTEVTGAIDVLPRAAEGNTKILVIGNLPDTITGSNFRLEAFAFEMGRVQKEAEISWETNLPNVQISEDNLLTFAESGPLTITARLNNDNTVEASADVVLEYNPETSVFNEITGITISVYPNPAKDYISISGISEGDIHIYDLAGNQVLCKKNYQEGNTLDTDFLVPGLYILKLKNEHGLIGTKLLID